MQKRCSFSALNFFETVFFSVLMVTGSISVKILLQQICFQDLPTVCEFYKVFNLLSVLQTFFPQRFSSVSCAFS